MKVVKVSAGLYRSEDGRYTIDQQPYERECECLSCQNGLHCPHDGIATDWFWAVWDEVEDDYAEGTFLSTFDRFKDAKEFVNSLD